ncbi:hypothetical protein [Kitasatospora sp. NPDC004531]
MTHAAVPERADTIPLDHGRTAVLRLPAESADRPAPAVLMLHPFGVWDRHAHLPAEASGNGEVRLFDDLGASLVEAGTGALSYDTRFLTEQWKDGAGSPRFTFTGLVDDAVHAARHLRAHPAVDADRVLLLGVSMGCEVALAAAERLGGESLLAMVAPSVEARPVFHRWLGLGRRLEWLAAGFTTADGTVDLAAALADTLGRSGWWETFDLVDRFGPHADLEVLRAELAVDYDAWQDTALADGDNEAPASFWRDWFAQPAPYRRLSTLTGHLTIHVGAEDWTTPTRQAHLLHRAALRHGLHSHLTIHPHLGHLMSPRTPTGRRTYGPFTPDFLQALTTSITEILSA